MQEASGDPSDTTPRGIDSQNAGAKRRKRNPSMSAQKSEAKGHSIEAKAKELAECAKEKESTRKWETWDQGSILRFHEAVKIHGKDFDAIRKFMVQKGGRKHYEQIRNFYYNSIKQIASCVVIPAEVCVPKEARELFLLVNFGEWLRKMGKRPLIADKFSELVVKGSTSIKVKGKPSQKHLRTPACVALRKLCDESDSADKPNDAQSAGRISQEVCVELLPRTYGDRAFVLRCEQNPFVRLRLDANEPLLPYFAHLQAKWTLPQVRQRERNLNEDVSNERPKVTLFAAKDTVLTEVALRPIQTVQTGANVTISLERCSQVRGGANTVDGISKAPNAGEVLSDTDKGGAEANRLASPPIAADSADPAATTAAGTSRILLEVERLKEGLNESNVADMTAAQLCLICNSQPVIRMVYQVETASKSTQPAPWQCLMSLILRDYGAQIHKSMVAQEAVKEAPAREMAARVEPKAPVAVAAPSAEHAKAALLLRKHNIDAQSVLPSVEPPKKRALPSRAQWERDGEAAAASVRAENSAFAGQWASLVAAPTAAFVVVQPQPQPVTTLLSTQPQPRYVLVTNGGGGGDAAATSTPLGMRPAAVVVPAASSASVLPPASSVAAAAAVSSGGPLLTPTNSQLAAPSAPAAAAQPIDFSLFHSHAATSSSLANLSQESCSSMNLESIMSSPLRFQLPANISLLPDDVRLSFEQMMQQNSVDYCRSFEELAQTLETPKKNSS